MKKIILIDNYDSFTFNLYHYLSSLKVNVEVIRNDQITSHEILKKRYHKVVISPGPGGIGYFAANGEFDTCIALRTAVAKKDKFYVQAGAGIVADSKPLKEYEETVNKAKALINALK